MIPKRRQKPTFAIILLLLLTGCSAPPYYLDIRYEKNTSSAEPFPIDIFITNAHLGTIVHVEGISLTGSLAESSLPYPGREGLYTKQNGSSEITAKPNRKLTQFETGGFPITLRLLGIGKQSGTIQFTINGEMVTKEIDVDIR